MPVLPRRSSPYVAAAAMVFARRYYLRLACQHNLAVVIQSPDMREKFDRGEYPPVEWAQETTETASEYAQEVTVGLRASFFSALLFLFVGLAAAVAFGKVSPDLPVSLSKCISTAGGFLAAWATLFELGGYAETYNGEALHEIARAVLFKFIFLPGLAVAALGQLW